MSTRRRGARMLARAVIAVAAGLSVLALACDDDGSSNGEPALTSTPTPAVTETSLPTETPVREIRTIDLTQQMELGGFLTSSGGVVEPEAIIYADLTEDGIDDAIVPVSSGGEGGDIAVFVYGFTEDGLTLLLQDGGRIRVALEGGQLAVTKPDFAPGDALCCPSQLRQTLYRWDGSALVVDKEAVQDAQ